MPVVPRSPMSDNVVPFKPKLPEPWALMAAAQMHSEGRLIEPTSAPTSGTPNERTSEVPTNG